ncbi:MAG: bacteriohemerythrin [Methylovulum sp.]|jgi:hemerythrin-like metal-binding protein/PAS domain S-box-containing protein|nr:bacteriohemerythrin [Methylovulum sp.]MCF7998782.1 bacteriohemerythrin [Methylovulum sp.]
MTILNWNNQLALGIASVDEQHQHLIDLTNQLDEALAIGAEHDALIKIIKGLVDYTVYHFRHEEQLMEAAQFNPTIYAEHKAEHDEFVTNMLKTQENLQSDQQQLSEELIDYLVNWLCHHILNTDKKMALSLINGIDAADIKIDSQEHHDIMQSNLHSALRESESRFKELAENISALIWITNTNHVPIFCNQFWFNTYHLQASTMTRQQWLNAIHPDDRDIVTESYRRAAEERSKFKIQYRLQNADGKITWIYETAVPRIQKNGRFAGLMGCGMDITSQKQAEAVLTRSNAQLEDEVAKRTQELFDINRTLEFEKNQQLLLNNQLKEAQIHLVQAEKMASIGQLAAGIAHEINNPLGYINSNLSSLKQYTQAMIDTINMAETLSQQLPADHPDVLRFKQLQKNSDLNFLKTDLPDLVNESIEGVTRTKKIVQDLRDFSRIDKPELGLFDVEAGLDATLNIAHNELKYKAQVIKDYAGLQPFECVGAQLNQVFLNLLVNAAQAIEKFGKIYVRTGYLDADWLWIEIEDTGKGIPEEIHAKIFDPFFTTKPVGKGTGLGLSLSYQIIQKHHGRIELESTLGKGSRFRIIFPIHPSK